MFIRNMKDEEFKALIEKFEDAAKELKEQNTAFKEAEELMSEAVKKIKEVGKGEG